MVSTQNFSNTIKSNSIDDETNISIQPSKPMKSMKFSFDSVIQKSFLWLVGTSLPFGALCTLLPKFIHHTTSFKTHKNLWGPLLIGGQFLSLVTIYCHSKNIFKQWEAYKIYHISKQAETFDSMSNQKLAVIFQSKRDKHHIFKNKEEKIFIIRNLVRAGYLPIFKKISNIETIANDLNKLSSRGNRIQILWLRAHGCPQALILGPGLEDDLDANTILKFKKNLNTIDVEATIILDSCSTAKMKSRKSPDPIAKIIAQNLPGRVVFAANDQIDVDAIKILQLNPLTVEFRATLYDQGAYPNMNVTTKYCFKNDEKK